MALLDTIDKADPECKDTQLLKDTFTDLMEAMLRYQDESGMWYQVVNYGTLEPNYLETSGSSIMAYALLKGCLLYTSRCV